MTRLARELNVPGQDAREQDLRNFLGQFNFAGDMVHQTVGTLSGGERARLVLAGIVWQRPNLLLLDEPTNHLDLTTREALSMALNEFEGTVMLVSHDRAMLREVCDEFWLVTRGGVLPFDGDLDDYQRWLLEVSRAAARGLPAPPVPACCRRRPRLPRNAAAAPSADSRCARGKPLRATTASRKGQARSKLADQTRPLRNELAQIDQRLAKLAAERTRHGSLTRRSLAGAGRDRRRRPPTGACRRRGGDARRALARAASAARRHGGDGTLSARAERPARKKSSSPRQCVAGLRVQARQHIGAGRFKQALQRRFDGSVRGHSDLGRG